MRTFLDMKTKNGGPKRNSQNEVEITLNVLNGTDFSQTLINSRSTRTVQTGDFVGLTDIPNNNNTQIFSDNTSVPNNITTSFNLTKNINKDDIHTNDINFKVGDKSFSETYPIYPYIYGKRYILN
jgi:hypothetical protein